MIKSNPILLLLLLPLFMACSEGNSQESFFGGGGSAADAPEEKGFVYDKQEASQYISDWVDTTALKVKLPQIKEEKVAADLFAFYNNRNFEPAWSAPAAREMLSILQNIKDEGLNTASYPIDDIDNLITQARSESNAETGARLDILLSATYLKLADVLATGKVKPGDYYNAWHIRPEAPDTLVTHLQKAVGNGGVDVTLDYFRPRFEQYAKLQQHIDRYTKIMEQGGWPQVETGAALKPGDSSQRIASIRKRLHITGDLETPPAQWTTPAVYDSTLIAAVNHFQERMGLEQQATITEDMIEALNIPAEMRLKQIVLNLDRIRWFSSGEMPPTYVFVNIPEYRMQVVENGEKIKSMKVVVGERMNTTPIFSDKIEYSIFSPYWNVPTSIAMNEIWPKVRNDYGYLRRNHYEILTGWGENASVISPSQVNWSNLSSYRIRQTPGPWNALGRVKFIFPNDFAIYLHDTPSDYLFDRTQRAFSHGCIRVAEPAWFADWLFPQYSREEVKQKMNNSNRDVVSLENDIPVYIFYLTTFVDDEGEINFREDLYELDKKLTKAFDVI